MTDGRVWLNSRPVRVLSRTVQLADVVDVLQENGEPVGGLPPSDPPVFLHRDPWLVAVNKPAGVASQAPRRRQPGELALNEQVALSLAWETGHAVQASLVHRLDRLTTGVMVFACNPDATRGLARIWGRGEAVKKYLAVVAGTPPERPVTCKKPLGPDTTTPGKFRVMRGGRPAATRVRTLAVLGEYALVEAQPLTGRTHQVRIHLAAMGAPVAGDAMYGGSRHLPRAFLHSWRLELPHPHSGTPLVIEAPLPRDMAAWLAQAGLDPSALTR